MDILEENETIKTIGKNDINNNTFSNDHVHGEIVQAWFNKSNIGNNITLEYTSSDFSDNKNLIKLDEIK